MKKGFSKGFNLEKKEVKEMKKILLVAVMCLVIGMAGSAQAFWVGEVYNPNVGMVPGIMGFDWSSSGSGAALNLGSMGDPTHIVPGTNFDFFVQASLVGVTNSVGAAIPAFTNGLNSNFEYTLVAKVPETVLFLTPIGGGLFTATFDVVGPGSWYLYYDSPTTVGLKSDVPTGIGFEDGIAIASGTFNFAGTEISTFTLTSGLPNVQGIGSFILEGLVTPGSVDPFYLDPAITIFDFRAEGTLNQPPIDSTTLGFFDVAGGPYARYILGSSPNGDQAFKVDASSKFTTIPEPSTMLLLGAGLLGLAGLGYSRKKD